jgi:hypothetical protein
MWLANEYDEWKKTERERENVLSDGGLNVREEERENQPVICSFLTFFSSSFSHDVRT